MRLMWFHPAGHHNSIVLDRLELLAGEVGCMVGVSAALVHRFLWIRAEGSRKRDALSWVVVDIMRRNDALRRNVLLDPLHQRSEHVEHVCARAAAAVVHPGYHEEPVKLLRPIHRISKRRLARKIHDALEVIDAGQGRYFRIAKPVVLNELATLRPELAQVGIDRVENRRQGLTWNDYLVVHVGWVGGPVESSKVPTRIVEDEVLEKGNANLRVMVGLLRRRWLWRDAERPAIGFAAPFKGRVIVMLVDDLIRAGPDISDRFHLLGRKAARRLLGSLAQQLFGIEVAASGIIQEAVHYPVEGVARGVDGVAEERVFTSKNGAGRIVEHLPHNPQIPANMMMRVVSDRITGNDTVIVVREALGFHQRLSPTR